jgi:hypothetical protein
MGGMSVKDLQTLTKARRNRTLSTRQGRLILRFPEGLDERSWDDPSQKSDAKQTAPVRNLRSRDSSTCSPPVDAKPFVEHPLEYRKVIANWSDDWRERWGHRANSLEDLGLAWRDAEAQAFIDVLRQIKEGAKPVPGSHPQSIQESPRTDVEISVTAFDNSID